MAIQLIDTVTPDIGLKTVADKLNNNFTDPENAASRLVTSSATDTTPGKLLKTGDLGSNMHTLAVVDFNELPELYPYSGLIPVLSDAGSTNTPPKSNYYHVFQTLYAAGVPSDNVTQIAIPYRVDNDGFFLRNRYDSVWSPWREILHTGNILTTTGSSTTFPMSQKATTDAINGISDERDKTDVHEIGLGLEVIENLKTFSFKLNKRDWYRQQAAKELIEVEEEDGKVTTQEKINDDVLNAPLSDFEENDGSLKRDDVYTGFVAQDLKETLESLDLGHLGIVKNYADEYEGGEDRFYIEHLALLPFLVNSIKQLSARVKELEDAAK